MFNFKTTVLGLLLLLIFALPIGDYAFYSLYYAPVQKQSVAELEMYYPKILADLKLIDQNPIFNKFTFDKNAEEIFEKNLSWSGLKPEAKYDLNHTNLRNFTQKYKLWKKDPEVLETMLADPNIHTIDTGWMDTVLNYDHWNISNNPNIKTHLAPLKELDSLEKMAVFSQLPIPDYLELRDWTLVYFLKQHKKMNTLQGLKVYRKIAELSYSSSSTIASVISTKLLEDEAYLAERFQIKDWVAIDNERINAFRRSAWTWTRIARNSLHQIIPLEVRDLIKYENGICSAAWEVAPNIALLNDFLIPRFVLETDHSVDVARFQETVDKLQTICKLDPYKSFGERSPASVGISVSELSESFQQKSASLSTDSYLAVAVRKIPYMRRMFIYVLHSTGSTDTSLSRHYDTTK